MKKKAIKYIAIVLISFLLAGIVAASEFNAYSTSTVAPINNEQAQDDTTAITNNGIENIEGDIKGDITGEFIDENTIYFEYQNTNN